MLVMLFFYFKRVKFSLCVSVAQGENAKEVLAAIIWKGEMMNFVSMFLEPITRLVLVHR